MQSSIDFNDYPKTGRNCPDTSFEAAHKVSEKAETLREVVYKFIKRQGKKGATAHEIHLAIGGEKNSTSPRITELKDKGLVIGTENRRINENGNKSMVWVVKDCI